MYVPNRHRVQYWVHTGVESQGKLDDRNLSRRILGKFRRKSVKFNWTDLLLNLLHTVKVDNVGLFVINPTFLGPNLVFFMCDLIGA